MITKMLIMKMVVQVLREVRYSQCELPVTGNVHDVGIGLFKSFSGGESSLGASWQGSGAQFITQI
jgi:hypothetical protein